MFAWKSAGQSTGANQGTRIAATMFNKRRLAMIKNMLDIAAAICTLVVVFALI